MANFKKTRLMKFLSLTFALTLLITTFALAAVIIILLINVVLIIKNTITPSLRYALRAKKHNH